MLKNISLKGFRMPGEWEVQKSVWIIWPYNKKDWPGLFNNIPKVISEIVGNLSINQKVNLIINNHKDKIKVKKISNSVSLIDADNSIGFVSANLGIKEAIKNAKKSGIGFVGIKKSSHYGLSGFYAEKAVKKNLIAMIYTNAPPAVAPHGSSKSLFGTNPICFGAPTGNKAPFILDTSIYKINRGTLD